jgi:hypothetical protein
LFFYHFYCFYLVSKLPGSRLPFTQMKPLAQFPLLDILIVNYRLGTPVFVLLK